MYCHRALTDRRRVNRQLSRFSFCLLAASCVVACSRSVPVQPEPEQPMLRPAASGPIPGVPGMWARVKIPGVQKVLAPEQASSIVRLQSLGYVGGSRPRVTDHIVTVHRRGRVSAGLNFYVSAHGPEAILMDMDGTPLHCWTCSALQVWPGLSAAHLDYETKDFWRRAYLLPNGDVLANFNALGLVKLDKDSNVIWSLVNQAHHDIDVAPNGDIYVLTQSFTVVKEVDSGPVVEDCLSVLDANGVEKQRISLLLCAQELADRLGVELPIQLCREVTHANTIQILDGSAEHLSSAFKAGNVLLSFRELNLLAVLDLAEKRFVWHLASGSPLARGVSEPSGLAFRGQHEPTLLPSGHMLLFDNQGQPHQSAIWEFHPITHDVFWCYRGTTQHPFYSAICGTVQRLPNGNTLITESDNGRAFEVTPEQEIVWEFYNPHRAGEQGEYIAMVSELVRLAPDFPTDWVTSNTIDSQ